MARTGAVQGPTTRRRQAGYSLLELIVVVIIIMLLAGFAIDRLVGLQVDAERVQMQRVISTLQSAARMEMAEIIVQGDQGRLARLHGGNPMALLEEPPPNYRTDSSNSDENTVQPTGYWAYKDGYLFYYVDNTRYFQSQGPEGAVRFRLNVRYDDSNGDGAFTPGTDHPRALVVEAVDDYRWLREPVASAVADLETGSHSGS